jgi:hypothetical protein
MTLLDASLFDQTLQTIGTVLGYALGAALLAMAPAIGNMVVQGARLLASKWQYTLTAKQEQDIRFAAEHSVLATAARLAPGTVKKLEAIETAKSLAPQAFGKLELAQQEVVIEATYQRMRPSLQTPSSPPSLSFPPGTMLQVVSEPPVIPRAPAVPSEGTTFVEAVDDRDTNPGKLRKEPV